MTVKPKPKVLAEDGLVHAYITCSSTSQKTLCRILVELVTETQNLRLNESLERRLLYAASSNYAASKLTRCQFAKI